MKDTRQKKNWTRKCDALEGTKGWGTAVEATWRRGERSDSGEGTGGTVGWGRGVRWNFWGRGSQGLGKVLRVYGMCLEGRGCDEGVVWKGTVRWGCVLERGCEGGDMRGELRCKRYEEDTVWGSLKGVSVRGKGCKGEYKVGGDGFGGKNCEKRVWWSVYEEAVKQGVRGRREGCEEVWHGFGGGGGACRAGQDRAGVGLCDGRVTQGPLWEVVVARRDSSARRRHKARQRMALEL